MPWSMNTAWTSWILWGPGEEGLVARVTGAMHNRPLVLPETTLAELGAFLKRCGLLVSNDSAPMHMAAALNVPTVGIFGPTDPRAQGPWGDWSRRGAEGKRRLSRLQSDQVSDRQYLHDDAGTRGAAGEDTRVHSDRNSRNLTPSHPNVIFNYFGTFTLTGA